MRTLSMFNSISLDGFFTDVSNDMSWAHRGGTDAEMQDFTNANASGEGALLFGRVTYDLMRAFWPTEMARQQMPEIAKGMNEMPKFVASHTLTSPDWRNTTVLQGDLVSAVKALKAKPGPGITIMGSGQIVAQLTEAGLIDEYQFIVIPMIIGSGRSLFDGVTRRPSLRRTGSRLFANGNIHLTYVPE